MTTVTDNENQAATGATESGGGRFDNVRTKASDAYQTARQRTSSAYGTARERAASATRKTAEQVDSNPGAALIGGLALGALAAVLLPKSRKEEELLGDYSRQLNDKAKQAAQAAKEAGRSKLDELGFNKDTAKQKLSEVASQAKEAAKTSASAAAQAVKSGGSQQGQDATGSTTSPAASTLPTA
jgi:ElaB/YqjD/DUF883 family membrane-anchored ribosome-binding protein